MKIVNTSTLVIENTWRYLKKGKRLPSRVGDGAPKERKQRWWKRKTRLVGPRTQCCDCSEESMENENHAENEGDWQDVLGKKARLTLTHETGTSRNRVPSRIALGRNTLATTIVAFADMKTRVLGHYHDTWLWTRSFYQIARGKWHPSFGNFELDRWFFSQIYGFLWNSDKIGKRFGGCLKNSIQYLAKNADVWKLPGNWRNVKRRKREISS